MAVQNTTQAPQGGNDWQAEVEKRKQMQDESFRQQMAMFDLQQKAHQQQQMMMGLSNIEKGSDDVLKNIAGNLK